ncbi:MAG: folate-binding protein [Erythrobacter sp.]
MTATRLAERAIVRLAPLETDEDVAEFLQGLITNDVSGPLPVYAALLSAQGKTMFDFLVWPGEDGVLLIDCERQSATDLIKRLSLYRLRRKIDISQDENLCVHWSKDGSKDGGKNRNADAKPDPRLEQLGFRWLAPAADTSSDDAKACDELWRAHRLSLGVTEGEAELSDILWLETNAIELNGVSFEKGCYIGQENTARMNWRQKINRRLVVVPLAQSNEKRRKVAVPDLDLAIDHLRVADLDKEALPDWQRRAIAG